MNKGSYILDAPLPVSQDFKALKEMGLAYIQKHGGSEWTNLNPSDPGVTILDQLCYAFTELGYCNDFPVADILTGPDGKLKTDDQFYLPEKILTTCPVTTDDYRKYIIDAVDGVSNVVIIPYPNAEMNIYKLYLLLDESVVDGAAVCQAAFFYLNKCRNLGEIFLMPLVLRPDPWLLNGSIELTGQKQLNDIITELHGLIRNYIFPGVSPAGYDPLTEEGILTNDIFNGPLLKNGWLPGKLPGEKRNSLRIMELENIIQSVAGVASVSLSGFSKTVMTDIEKEPGTGQGLLKKMVPAMLPEVHSAVEEIITIDLVKSLTGSLIVSLKGTDLPSGTITNAALNPGASGLQGLGSNIHPGASVQIQTSLPETKFRDINSYYSIQNTFPEIFSVGADTVTSNASEFQVAQSRQLKGYLTLFDQVLANQFSQLANIDKLFSFKNASSGAPSDESSFYAVKDEFEKKQLQYPVPYLAFSPTYFYQSLYDVPHIKPLLKDNDIFKFSVQVEPEKLLEQKSWTAYKLDPYNPYMKGLMDLMEDEKINLSRRNEILDHLLARHGESPLLVNSIIDGSIYSGDSLKDKLVFKSLYLQNLGLLSYFRQKAYNFTGANKIPELILLHTEQKTHGDDSTDFIFNARKIDHIEKLTERDFINCSGLELKLGLLFGLKVFYHNYIRSSVEKQNTVNKYTARWMISQRKGLILIETGLLVQYAPALLTLTTDPSGAGPYWQVSERFDFSGLVVWSKKLNYEDAMAVEYSFDHDDQSGLPAQIQNGVLVIGEFSYPVKSISGFDLDQKLYKPIPGTDYFFAFTINHAGETGNLKNISVPDNRIDLIFPDLSPELNNSGLKNRLDLFLQGNLPVQLPCKYHFVDCNQFMTSVIPSFVRWHNCLLYDERGHRDNDKLAASARKLIFQLAAANIF